MKVTIEISKEELVELQAYVGKLVLMEETRMTRPNIGSVILKRIFEAVKRKEEER